MKAAVGSDDLSLIQLASSDFVFFFDMLSPDASKFKVFREKLNMMSF